MRLTTVLALLLLLTGLAGAQGHVDPATHALRVFDIPVGADAGLTLHTDTMHVTTAEQGWALTANTVKVVIVNPNGNYLLWRLDTEASPLQMYIGDYGSDVIESPGMIAAGMDSLFIDGEAACTIYVRWWSFD